jgi:hypothetical protein
MTDLSAACWLTAVLALSPFHSLKIPQRGLQTFREQEQTQISSINVYYDLTNISDILGSFPGGGKVFVLSIKCRPALGPTHSPVQWALAGLAIS